MISLLKNVELYAPDYLGQQDILIAGHCIAMIAKDIDTSLPYTEVIDGQGKIAFPGLVDNHVIVQGGGGESGFTSRTPELKVEDAIRGGVTSLVGVRGTDGMARDLRSMLAKVKSINESGLSCWMLTGSYQMPVKTLAGSISDDIMFIEEIIGVGEIAISDHRSSHPSYKELVSMVAECRVAGMLSGKAGLVKFHLGDDPEGISMLLEMLRNTSLPSLHFLPTHINRNPGLLKQGIEFAKEGGILDFTTSSVPIFLEQGSALASDALIKCLEAGVPLQNMTFSSDGQGSLPAFDEEGHLLGLSYSTPRSLFQEIVALVKQHQLPMEKALAVATSNPANIYKLKGKGRVAQGMDADIVLASPEDLTITDVIAKGKIMLRNGEIKAELPLS